MNPWLPVVVLLVASAGWGLTWMPLKHFGDYGIRGVWVTLVAHGTVGALALPLLWRTRRQWLGSWRTMALLAVSGGLANLAFATAIVSGDVLRVMALFYLLPAWGVIGGRVLLGEVIDRSRQLSLLGALAGAFLVLGGTELGATPPTWIDAAALGSGMALGLHNVLFRRAQGVPVVTKVGFNFVGCLGWAALLVALGAAPAPGGVPPAIWAQVVGFGVVWILLATAGTLWGVHHLEAGRSSVLIIMELVTAVVSSALLNARPIAIGEWVGGGLILSAALIEARRPARR
jgi:drug/metabolite transporter (DMT)-like permease